MSVHIMTLRRQKDTVNIFAQSRKKKIKRLSEKLMDFQLGRRSVRKKDAGHFSLDGRLLLQTLAPH